MQIDAHLASGVQNLIGLPMLDQPRLPVLTRGCARTMTRVEDGMIV